MANNALEGLPAREWTKGAFPALELRAKGKSLNCGWLFIRSGNLTEKLASPRVKILVVFSAIINNFHRKVHKVCVLINQVVRQEDRFGTLLKLRKATFSILDCRTTKPPYFNRLARDPHLDFPRNC